MTPRLDAWEDPGGDDARARRARRLALAGALLLHLGLLFLTVGGRSGRSFPEEPAGGEAPRLARYLPAPPPALARPEPPRRVREELAPVPDPDLEEREPVADAVPLPELAASELSIDWIGEPVAPGTGPGGAGGGGTGEGGGGGGQGPYHPGAGGVTDPVLIPGTQVLAAYPRVARAAGVSSNVVLSAVVTRQGDVTDLRVLFETEAGYGFAESAIQAVRQWKYIPGKKDGKPVDVYMTVTVEFRIGAGGGR